MEPTAIVEVRGLSVSYPNARALEDVSLSVARGSFVLIGGASGSGKSTLAQALLGLLREGHASISAEVTGEISVAGSSTDHGDDGNPQAPGRVGLVFQNPSVQLFNGTVREEVAFGPRNLGLSGREITERVAYALDATGCRDLIGRRVRHLSAGEQQRVAIAANLAMRPSVLVLDEPTANLDEAGTRAVVEALRALHQSGVTVVLIEHRLRPFVSLADRAIWLDDGRVVADGPPDVIRQRLDTRPPSSSYPVQRPGRPLVSVEGVWAGYDGRPVLRGCSLTLQKGEFAALVGANGAGKSTLARVIGGVLRPRRGRVVWHSKDRRGARVGLVEQNPLHQLVCNSVEEEVSFGPENFGRTEVGAVEKLLARTDLLRLRRRATQSLSVGEQQRTALAAALSLRPSLLILDEPTIGQDWEHLRAMMGLVSELNRRGQTVLMITHDWRLVESYAERVCELDEGGVQEVYGEQGWWTQGPERGDGGQGRRAFGMTAQDREA